MPFSAGQRVGPLGFCHRNGLTAPTTPPDGHDRFAIRIAGLGGASDGLTRPGARMEARHRLRGGGGPVEGRFLSLGKNMFDEFPNRPSANDDRLGWVGLLAIAGTLRLQAVLASGRISSGCNAPVMSATASGMLHSPGRTTQSRLPSRWM